MHVHMAGAVFMIVLPDQALPGLGNAAITDRDAVTGTAGRAPERYHFELVMIGSRGKRFKDWPVG
jgi:hypothetical protein